MTDEKRKSSQLPVKWFSCVRECWDAQLRSRECHNLVSIHFKIHQLLISSFIQSQTFSEDDLIQRKISAKNREKRDKRWKRHCTALQLCSVEFSAVKRSIGFTITEKTPPLWLLRQQPNFMFTYHGVNACLAGEGPSRGLLRDCTTSPINRLQH